MSSPTEVAALVEAVRVFLASQHPRCGGNLDVFPRASTDALINAFRPFAAPAPTPAPETREQASFRADDLVFIRRGEKQAKVAKVAEVDGGRHWIAVWMWGKWVRRGWVHTCDIIGHAPESDVRVKRLRAAEKTFSNCRHEWPALRAPVGGTGTGEEK